MSETVRDLLHAPLPTDFRAIERALVGQRDRCEEAEAALSTLILRRRTQGEAGLYQALTSPDCARRLTVLAEHLREVGARRAAAAVRLVRARLPRGAAQTPGSLLEALDDRPEILPLCRSLDAHLDGIDDALERYLRDCPDEVLDVEVRQGGPLKRLRRFFV